MSFTAIGELYLTLALSVDCKYNVGMEAKYSPRHLQSMFNLSPQSVRTYAAEFKRHLSIHANPGNMKHRAFTEDDVKVMALVADMRKNKVDFEDIHAALAAGERGEAPPVPPDELVELVLSPQARDLLNSLTTLDERITALENSQGTKDAADLETARQEIRRLEREIGRLEALLEVERQRNQDTE